MLACLPVIFFGFFSSVGLAYPDSIYMSCKAAKDYIDQRGNAILATCGERATFTTGFCPHGQTAAPAYVTTNNRWGCFVGFYCTSIFGKGAGPHPYLQDGGDTCR